MPLVPLCRFCSWFGREQPPAPAYCLQVIAAMMWDSQNPMGRIRSSQCCRGACVALQAPSAQTLQMLSIMMHVL